MLKIHFYNGIAFTNHIIVDTNEHSDVVRVLDNYREEGNEFPCCTYTWEEIVEHELESYAIPISGGEFYVTVEHIEVI